MYLQRIIFIMLITWFAGCDQVDVDSLEDESLGDTVGISISWKDANTRTTLAPGTKVQDKVVFHVVDKEGVPIEVTDVVFSIKDTPLRIVDGVEAPFEGEHSYFSDKSTHTDENGDAWVIVSTTTMLNVRIDIDVTIPKFSGATYRATLYTHEFGIPDGIEIETTHLMTETAGENFAFKIYVIDEVRNRVKGFDKEMTVYWDFIHTPSWAGKEAVLPALETVCKFVDGVCTTGEDFFLTNALETPKVSVYLEKLVVIPGQEAKSLKGIVREEITVVKGEPSYVYVSQNEPNELIYIEPPESVTITADETLTFFASSVDKAGNFIDRVNANWAPTGVLENRLDTTSAAQSVTVTPVLSGDGEIDVSFASFVGKSPLVVIEHGALHHVAVTTEHEGQENAGECFATQFALRDQHDNLMDSVTERFDTTLTLMNTESGHTVRDVAHFKGTVREGAVVDEELRFRNGVAGSTYFSCLFDATDVQPQVSIALTGKSDHLIVEGRTDVITINKSMVDHLLPASHPGNHDDWDASARYFCNLDQISFNCLSFSADEDVFPIYVVALDRGGNFLYNPEITVSADYPLNNAVDLSGNEAEILVTPNKHGSGSIHVTDLASNHDQDFEFSIVPGSLHHFMIASEHNGVEIATQGFGAEVIALDRRDNVIFSMNDPIPLTIALLQATPSPVGTLPRTPLSKNVQFTAGVASIGLTSSDQFYAPNALDAPEIEVGATSSTWGAFTSKRLLMVRAGDVNTVVIETESLSQGKAVPDDTIVIVGTSQPFFAAGYDSELNYVGDVLSDWFVDGGLDPAGSNNSALVVDNDANIRVSAVVLSPKVIGIGRLFATPHQDFSDPNVNANVHNFVTVQTPLIEAKDSDISHFEILPYPISDPNNPSATVTAGESLGFLIYARDYLNNIDTDYEFPNVNDANTKSLYISNLSTVSWAGFSATAKGAIACTFIAGVCNVTPGSDANGDYYFADAYGDAPFLFVSESTGSNGSIASSPTILTIIPDSAIRRMVIVDRQGPSAVTEDPAVNIVAAFSIDADGVTPSPAYSNNQRVLDGVYNIAAQKSFQFYAAGIDRGGNYIGRVNSGVTWSGHLYDANDDEIVTLDDLGNPANLIGNGGIYDANNLINGNLTPDGSTESVAFDPKKVGYGRLRASHASYGVFETDDVTVDPGWPKSLAVATEHNNSEQAGECFSMIYKIFDADMNKLGDGFSAPTVQTTMSVVNTDTPYGIDYDSNSNNVIEVDFRGHFNYAPINPNRLPGALTGNFNIAAGYINYPGELCLFDATDINASGKEVVVSVNSDAFLKDSQWYPAMSGVGTTISVALGAAHHMQFFIEGRPHDANAAVSVLSNSAATTGALNASSACVWQDPSPSNVQIASTCDTWSNRDETNVDGFGDIDSIRTFHAVIVDKGGNFIGQVNSCSSWNGIGVSNPFTAFGNRLSTSDANQRWIDYDPERATAGDLAATCWFDVNGNHLNDGAVEQFSLAMAAMIIPGKPASALLNILGQATGLTAYTANTDNLFQIELAAVDSKDNLTITYDGDTNVTWALNNSGNSPNNTTAIYPASQTITFMDGVYTSPAEFRISRATATSPDFYPAAELRGAFGDLGGADANINIEVVSGAPETVVLRDMANGDGNVFNDARAHTTADDITLYAAGYDKWGNYVVNTLAEFQTSFEENTSDVGTNVLNPGQSSYPDANDVNDFNNSYALSTVLKVRRISSGTVSARGQFDSNVDTFFTSGTFTVGSLLFSDYDITKPGGLLAPVTAGQTVAIVLKMKDVFDQPITGFDGNIALSFIVSDGAANTGVALYNDGNGYDNYTYDKPTDGNYHFSNGESEPLNFTVYNASATPTIKIDLHYDFGAGPVILSHTLTLSVDPDVFDHYQTEVMPGSASIFASSMIDTNPFMTTVNIQARDAWGNLLTGVGSNSVSLSAQVFDDTNGIWGAVPSNGSVDGNLTAIDVSSGVASTAVRYNLPHRVRFIAAGPGNANQTPAGAVSRAWQRRLTQHAQSVHYYTLAFPSQNSSFPKAGVPFNMQVQAFDDNNDLVTTANTALSLLNYTYAGAANAPDGTVATFPATASFGGGTATVSGTFFTMESIATSGLTINDNQSPSRGGVSIELLDIKGGSLDTYTTTTTDVVVTADDNATFSLTIAALDSWGNSTAGDPSVNLVPYRVSGHSNLGTLRYSGGGLPNSIDLSLTNYPVVIPNLTYDVGHAIKVNLFGTSRSVELPSSTAIQFYGSGDTISSYEVFDFPSNATAGWISIKIKAFDDYGNQFSTTEGDANMDAALSALRFEAANAELSPFGDYLDMNTSFASRFARPTFTAGVGVAAYFLTKAKYWGVGSFGIRDNYAPRRNGHSTEAITITAAANAFYQTLDPDPNQAKYADEASPFQVIIQTTDPFGNLGGPSDSNVVCVAKIPVTGAAATNSLGGTTTPDMSSSASKVISVFYLTGEDIRIDCSSPTLLSAYDKGDSFTITGGVSEIDHYVIQSLNPSPTAGVVFSIRVTALDANNDIFGTLLDSELNATSTLVQLSTNSVTNYDANSASLRIYDDLISYTNDSNWSNGSILLDAVVYEARIYSGDDLKVGDGMAVSHASTGLLSPINVQSAALNEYEVDANQNIGQQIADGNTPFGIVILPKDKFGNTTSGEANVSLTVTRSDGTALYQSLDGGTTTGISTVAGATVVADFKYRVLETLKFTVNGTAPYDDSSDSKTLVMYASVDTIDYLTLSGSPATVTAGTPFLVSVKIYDIAGTFINNQIPGGASTNSELDANDWVIMAGPATSPTGQIAILTWAPFYDGNSQFQASFYTKESLLANALVIKKTDKDISSTSSSAINVEPAVFAFSNVSRAASTPVPGNFSDSVTVNIVAFDSYGNITNGPGSPVALVPVKAFSDPSHTAGVLSPQVFDSNIPLLSKMVDLSTSSAFGATGLVTTFTYGGAGDMYIKFGGDSYTPDSNAVIVTFTHTKDSVWAYSLNFDSPQTVGVTFDLTASAEDLFGNPVKGVASDLNNLSLNWNTNGYSLISSPSPYDVDANALTVKTPFDANGEIVLNATLFRAGILSNGQMKIVDNQLVEGQNNAVMTLSPSALDHYRTVLTGGSATIVAGSAISPQLNIEAKDVYGNTRDGADNVTLTLEKLSGATAPGTLTGTLSNIDMSALGSSGYLSSDLTYDVAREVRINATDGNGISTPPAYAQVIEWEADIETIVKWSIVGLTPADGPFYAGSTVNIDIRAMDANGNNVDNLFNSNVLDSLLDTWTFEFDRSGAGYPHDGNACFPTISRVSPFSNGVASFTFSFPSVENIPATALIIHDTTVGRASDAIVDPLAILQLNAVDHYFTERVSGSGSLDADGVASVAIRITPMDRCGTSVNGPASLTLQPKAYIPGYYASNGVFGGTSTVDVSNVVAAGPVTTTVNYKAAQEVYVDVSDAGVGQMNTTLVRLFFAPKQATIVNYIASISGDETVGVPFNMPFRAVDYYGNAVKGFDANLATYSFAWNPTALSSFKPSDSATGLSPLLAKTVDFVNGAATLQATFYKAETLDEDQIVIADGVTATVSFGDFDNNIATTSNTMTVQPNLTVNRYEIVRASGTGTVNANQGANLEIKIRPIDNYGNVVEENTNVTIGFSPKLGGYNATHSVGTVANNLTSLQFGAAKTTAGGGDGNSQWVGYNVAQEGFIKIIGGSVAHQDSNALLVTFVNVIETVDHFDLSYASPQTAGIAFPITVTARDNSNNPITDLAAVLNANYWNLSRVTHSATGNLPSNGQAPSNLIPLLAKNSDFNGSGVGTLNATFYNNETIGASSLFIALEDDPNSAGTNYAENTSSTELVINAAALDHYVVERVNGSGSVGANGTSTFDFTIWAKDSVDNTVPGAADVDVTWSIFDGNQTALGTLGNAANITNINMSAGGSNGSYTYSGLTYDVAHTLRFFASDGTVNTPTAFAATLAFTPVVSNIASYVLSYIGPISVGSPLAIYVTALDNYGNNIFGLDTTLDSYGYAFDANVSGKPTAGPNSDAIVVRTSNFIDGNASFTGTFYTPETIMANDLNFKDGVTSAVNASSNTLVVNGYTAPGFTLYDDDQNDANYTNALVAYVEMLPAGCTEVEKIKLTQANSRPSLSALGWVSCPSSGVVSDANWLYPDPTTDANNKTMYLWTTDIYSHDVSVGSSFDTIDYNRTDPGTQTLTLYDDDSNRSVKTNVTNVYATAGSCPSEIVGMAVSDSNSKPFENSTLWRPCSQGIAIVTDADWAYPVPASDSSKEMFLFLKDQWDNISVSSNDTIILDRIDPNSEILTLYDDDLSTTATTNTTAVYAKSAVCENNSQMILTQNSTPPSAYATGWRVCSDTPVTNGSWAYSTPTVNGSKIQYLWLMDEAGNISASQNASIQLSATIPAVRTLTLMDSNTDFTATTKTAVVHVRVDACNAGESIILKSSNILPSEIDPAWTACDQNDMSNGGWAYLSSGTSGSKTMWAWVKDSFGTRSVSFQDAIYLDVEMTAKSGSLADFTSSSLTHTNDGNNVYAQVTGCDDGNDFMLISQDVNTPDYSDQRWRPCSATKVTQAGWNYQSATDGSKTMYLFVRDWADNRASYTTLTIDVDSASPNAQTLTLWDNDSTKTAWTNTSAVWASADACPAGTPMMLLTSTPGIPFEDNLGWRSCSAIKATNANWAFDNASNELKTMHLWIKDEAGNISTSDSNTINLDTQTPVTRTLTLTDDDPNETVSTDTTDVWAKLSTCNSNEYFKLSKVNSTPNDSDSDWQPCAQTPVKDANWTYLNDTVAANKTMYAWIKDSAGNISGVMNDDIYLDAGTPSPRLFDLVDSSSNSITHTNDGNSVYVKLATASCAINEFVLLKSSVGTPAIGDPAWRSCDDTVAVTKAEWAFEAPTTDAPKTMYLYVRNNSGTTIASNSAAITLDTAKPAAKQLTLHDDDHPARTDLTNALAPSVSAADCSDANLMIVTSSAGEPNENLAGWSVCSGTPVSNGNWAFDSGTDGPHSLYLWIKDEAGNISVSTQATITLDRTKPVAQTLVLMDDDSTITLTTNVATVYAKAGACESDANMKLTRTSTPPGEDDSDWIPCATASSNDSNWAYSTPLVSGVKVQYLWMLDPAGNISTTLQQDNIALDVDVPSVHTLVLVDNSSSSATHTNDTTSAYAYANSCDPNDYMLVKSADTTPAFNDPSWTACSPTAVTHANWTFADSGNDSVKSMYLFVRDWAGNFASLSGDMNTITLDTNAPNSAALTLWDNDPVRTTITNNAAVFASVATCPAGSPEMLITALATDPNEHTPGWRACDNALVSDGAWAFDSLSDANHTLHLWLKDEAGNISPSQNDAIFVDVTKPVARVMTLFDDDGVSAMTTNVSAIYIKVDGCNADEKMKVSNSASTPSQNDTDWIACDTNVSHDPNWVFNPATTGNKIVYGWIMDAAGNISNTFQDDIDLDVDAPSSRAFTLYDDNNGASTTTNNATQAYAQIDATACAAGEQMLVKSDSNAPFSFDAGWIPCADANPNSHNAWTFLDSAQDGLKAMYLFIMDDADNISTFTSATITLDTNAPSTPTLVLFDDDGTTTALTNHLSVHAAAQSCGLDDAAMLVTASTDLPGEFDQGWLACDTSATTDPNWPDYDANDGTKTRYLWVKDAAGNRSGNDSETIDVDITAPGARAFTLRDDDSSNTSKTNSASVWAVASVCSGGEFMIVTDSNSSSPAVNQTGWIACSDSGVFVTDSNWSYKDAHIDGPKLMYMWFKDSAGNISAETATTITLDTTAPTAPNLTLYDDDGVKTAYTNDTGSSYAGAATCTDISSMLVTTIDSNITLAETANGWRSCATFAVTDSNWTYTVGEGSKTMYLWVKDDLGNISITPTTATITRDTVKPTAGALTLYDADSNALSSFTNAAAPVYASMNSCADANAIALLSTTAVPFEFDVEWTPCSTTATTDGDWHYASEASSGDKKMYLWVKDDAGNISTDSVDANMYFLTGSGADVVKQVPFTLYDDDEIETTCVNATTVRATIDGGSCNPNYNGMAARVVLKADNTTPGFVEFLQDCSEGAQVITGTLADSNDGAVNTLYMWQMDQAGNIGAVQSDSIIFDSNAPPVPAGIVFNDVNAANASAIDFDVTGITTVVAESKSFDYTITTDGGGGSVSGTIVVSSRPIQSVSNLDVSALSDGNLTLSVQMKDSCGNLSTAINASVTKKVTLPTLSLSGTPAAIESATAYNIGITGAEITHYRFDSVAAADCTGASYSDFTTKDTNITESFSVSGGDGNRTVCVTGRDSVGNLTAVTTSYTFLWDSATLPAQPTLSLAADGTITVTSNDQTTKDIYVDGNIASVAAWTSSDAGLRVSHMSGTKNVTAMVRDHNDGNSIVDAAQLAFNSPDGIVVAAAANVMGVNAGAGVAAMLVYTGTDGNVYKIVATPDSSGDPSALSTDAVVDLSLLSGGGANITLSGSGYAAYRDGNDVRCVRAIDNNTSINMTDVNAVDSNDFAGLPVVSNIGSTLATAYVYYDDSVAGDKYSVRLRRNSDCASAGTETVLSTLATSPTALQIVSDDSNFYVLFDTNMVSVNSSGSIEIADTKVIADGNTASGRLTIIGDNVVYISGDYLARIKRADFTVASLDLNLGMINACAVVGNLANTVTVAYINGGAVVMRTVNAFDQGSGSWTVSGSDYQISDATAATSFQCLGNGSSSSAHILFSDGTSIKQDLYRE